MNKHLLAGTMLTIAAVAQPAVAQDTAAAATPPAAAPAAPVLSPAVTGPLAGNSAPTNFDLGEFGKVYVTGVASGIARFQDHAVTGTGDHGVYGDLSNAQVFIQKIDGVFQFFVQAGVYSLPSLGTPYTRATRVTDSTFGPLPQAFIKIAPTANFSIQAGKMPTLIGAEYTFTFENMNIDRGLLWNLEPAVSKGVQANYTAGPLAFSVSLNDGFYSSKYSTVSGSVAYTIDPKNVLAFAASGNTKTTTKSTVSTPGILNNSSIYNLILTHTDGPWLIQPYVQYTHVDNLVRQFGTTSASTIGGAILAKYSFTPEFSLPVRGEYVSSSGTRGGTAASFL
ncbi:MAG: outer membrane beta-barrel protein, partial [Janthinobacterium lividum]